MKADIDTVASWGLLIAGGSGIAILLVWLAFCLVDKVSDNSDKRECQRGGGTVVHYDDKHDSYWRCEPPHAEKR